MPNLLSTAFGRETLFCGGRSSNNLSTDHLIFLLIIYIHFTDHFHY
jgi:hypothetical protein